MCLTLDEHMKNQHNDEDEEGNTCDECQAIFCA